MLDHQDWHDTNAITTIIGRGRGSNPPMKNREVVLPQNRFQAQV